MTADQFGDQAGETYSEEYDPAAQQALHPAYGMEQEAYDDPADYDDGGDPFPPLPLWSTLRDIYAAFFFQFGRILKITILPFLLSFIAYLAGDLWLSVNEVSSLAFWSIALLVQAFEIFLFYIYSLLLFRLLLLGPNTALPDMESERGWIVRLLAYGIRGLMLFLPIITVGVIGFVLIDFLASWEPAMMFAVIPIWLIFMLYLFTRFGFALPAASVDAPYSIFDSWTATKKVGMKALLISLLSVLPLFILTCVLIIFLNRMQPAIDLLFSDTAIYDLSATYWVTIPVGLFLTYLVSAKLIIAIAVMFYVRTGWRPGAVRADV